MNLISYIQGFAMDETIRVCPPGMEVDDAERLLNLAIAAANGIEEVVAQLRGRSDPSNNEGYNFQENLSSIAKRVYRARRKVDEVTNSEGFSASPAFDVLLDIYINMAGGRLVSVSSACIGAACPSTTALRWIKHLEHQGLLARAIDPLDHRRSYISLTSEGIAKIEEAVSHYRI